MLSFGQRARGIFGTEISSILLTYTNVEKKKVYYSFMYFFPKQIVLSPDQKVVFLMIPSTLIYNCVMGRRVAAARTTVALQAEQVALTQLRLTDTAHTYPVRDAVTHPWSWRLSKTFFASQHPTRSYHANLVCAWMRSLHHILGLKQIQRILPFVCMCCSFSAWWSDKFLELSRNLLTSNIFNNLLIQFQVCLSIALFPLSCFNVYLSFQMSLLSCVVFQ